jgi:hypothetical protein
MRLLEERKRRKRGKVGRMEEEEWSLVVMGKRKQGERRGRDNFIPFSQAIEGKSDLQTLARLAGST